MKQTTQQQADAVTQLAKAIQATVTAQADKCPDLTLPHCIQALAHVLAATIGIAADSEESVGSVCAVTSTVIANTAADAYAKYNANAPKHPQP